MPLTLRIQTYRNQPLAQAVECSFSEQGGSLGRAPENQLVLEDDSKYISRVHARIAFRDGGYYLTDTGGNPSVVNERPLGGGREVRLEHGHRILVGEYLLLADIWQEAPLVIAPVIAPAIAAPAYAPAAPAWPDDLASILNSVDHAHQAHPAMVDDPLGLVAPAPAFHGAYSDHVAPEKQAFSLPPVAAAVAVAAPAMIAIPAGYDPMADGFAAPAVAPPMPAAPAPVPVAVPVAAPLVVPAAVPAPAPAPVPASAPVSAPVPGAADPVLQALLEGLGLSGLRIDRPAADVARLVGALLREATAGTMDILLARALTKKESRIDMTMIAVRSNNPLKFFPAADGALTQMLTGAMNGYLEPLDAMRHAFDDLRAHEVAVIAGMRAALNAVLLRFDPAAIDAGLSQPSRLDKLLGASRKSRLWDRLVELYGVVAREADDDFQRLFGEKFSAAYAEQVARLRGAA
ncbi:type VI secretion system-associated FHA domain protein TagH [Janthinobacterium agaricidamnosum]|uniref:FHA domain protein n=1 Tax=Janthinobacterium agaricidamnosum NBRC 102515 = DSM 9628 TaxID=1349767 RepID=W0VB06_9BURK|nr:type VI secretion system-associated FHA domain protein TagH [Janthinobacterium agaricidamnosum]CDG85974.1 FHA domain protein [Janthinobacterium agaricidamnosum NBRC 102515 = DSM 9628]